VARRKIKRDTKGRRTDKVKRRERSEMERLRNQGLTDVEIGSKLTRDPRTVRTQLNLAEQAGFLTIRLREVGGTAADLERGRGGQLVAFTLGNCSGNVLTIERICLEVLGCQLYDELPHIGARVTHLKYEAKLSPNHLGEYIITEETFRYEGPGADDFDLVCDSPPGFRYNARLNVYYSDLATDRKFTLHSDAFDICFCREGDLLSRYRAKKS
jgi:hypothetical protein